MGRSRVGACDDRVGLSMSTETGQRWLQVFFVCEADLQREDEQDCEGEKN
jgi:hypothetical protein